jgi:hypothetical protein
MVALTHLVKTKILLGLEPGYSLSQYLPATLCAGIQPV